MITDVDLRILISQSRRQIGTSSGGAATIDLQDDDNSGETLSDISGALLELHQLTDITDFNPRPNQRAINSFNYVCLIPRVN
jgi:hypothetical protein